MTTSAPTTTGSRNSHTYFTSEASKQEIVDFAQLMRDLEAYLSANAGKAALVDPEGKHRPIPDEIFRALDQVATALASGNGVTVAPYGMLLTTQQAADFLGVSRPTLVKLLEAGEIDFEKPNRHRRVKLRALVEYQDRSRSERRGALESLARANADAKLLSYGKPSRGGDDPAL